MLTPLRILAPSPTNTFSSSSTAPHLWFAAAAAFGVQLVEVAVEDLHARADQRVRADADAGSLALDESVVVDLHAVAELDLRLRASMPRRGSSRCRTASRSASRTRLRARRRSRPCRATGPAAVRPALPLTRMQSDSARYFQIRAWRIADERRPAPLIATRPARRTPAIAGRSSSCTQQRGKAR